MSLLRRVLAVYYDRFDIVPKQVWNKTVVYIATTLLAFMAFASNNDSSVWYSLYRYIVPIAVLSILNTDILDKKLFNNVSPFFVFAIHIPVLQVVRTILIYLMGEVTSINIIPIYILIIIVTYIVIWCITKVSIRFINPFYKLLIGGRIS